MKADSILFDLDGTLWNATFTTEKFFAGRLKKLGYEVEIKQPLIQSVMGMRVEEIAHVYFKDYPEKDRVPMMYAANTGKTDFLAKHGGILYPAVGETLAQLAEKYKLFIVSNCSENYIEAFLEAHQFSKYFTGFENSGRTGKAKADNIRLVCELYDLKAPVYVGDIDKDRIASEQAEVPFIFASYGFGEAARYLAKIDSFDQLPQVLETLEV